MPNVFLLRPWTRTALAVLLLLPLLIAGCSDQAPEPKPVAQVPAANATAAPAENATAAASADNATQALGNATSIPVVEAPANATAACPAPAPADKAPAKADKAAAKPDKAPAKGTAAAKPDKTPAKAAAKPAKAPTDGAAAKALSGPMNLERAQEEFTSFTRQWMVKLSRNLLGGPARIAVTQDGGGYVARFSEVDQNTLELEVKATDSPSCPFVGILKYFETSYEARGDSPEAAKGGTFAQVRKVRFTELFRHSGKRWE